MSIPVSDHQVLSNLIAFASLVIAAIAVIYALFESRKARKVAEQANRIARKANELAEETVLMIKSQPSVKNLPSITMQFHVGKISRISSETDILTLDFINESPGAIVIDRVFIGAPFKVPMELPKKLGYREEFKVRIYIDDLITSPMTHHPRAASEDIENLRQLVEDEITKTTITIQMVNELQQHYEIDYNFSTSTKRFEASPLQVSYRASKVIEGK